MDLHSPSSRLRLLVLPIALLLYMAPLQSPAAVRCDGTLSKPEALICGNQYLLTLDQELNDAYAAALREITDLAALREQQRTWLKTVRDACGDSECLVGRIKNRIDALTLAKIAAQPRYCV